MWSLLLSFASLTTALNDGLPAGTDVKGLLGFSPLPTEAPIPYIRGGDRFRRQAASASQWNSICGYVDGDPANPYTCAPAQYCALNSNLGAIGCCTATFLGYDGVKSATGCGYGTACLDSTEFFSYCSSTNCALNSFLRWCTSARVPYCVTFVENGYSAFECASVRGLTRYVLASSTEVECATCSLTPTPSPSPTPSPRPNSDRNSPTTTAASPTTTTSSNSGSNPPPAAQDQSTGNALQKESNKIALGVGIGIGVPTFIVGLWALLRLC